MVLSYLKLLQPWHASATLSAVVVPSALRGVICSTEKPCVAYASWLKQYSQHPWARSRTSTRSRLEMRRLVMGNGVNLQLPHHFSERDIAQCRECHQMFHALSVNLFALLAEVDKILVLR